MLVNDVLLLSHNVSYSQKDTIENKLYCIINEERQKERPS